MSKIKKGIKVERIVDFIDPEVKFVSLVSHAANRTPFTILKSEGGTSMNKVMVSVLVPNTLSKEQVTKALKDFNAADKTEYDTYTKYQQVDISEIKEDTYQLVYVDKDTKIMGVLAELKTDTNGEGVEGEGVEKDSVDYATIDTILTEAYAFMDIMMGSLQQSGMKVDDRQTMILGALENFQTFVKTFFDNSDEKETVKTVSAEAVTEFISNFTAKEEIENVDLDEEEDSVDDVEEKPVDDTNPDPNTPSKIPEGAPAEGGPDSQKEVTIEAIQEMITTAISEIKIPEPNTEVTDALQKTIDTFAESTKTNLEELSEELKTVTINVEELQAQPISNKTKSLEDGMLSTYKKSDTEKKTTFNGALFNR